MTKYLYETLNIITIVVLLQSLTVFATVSLPICQNLTSEQCILFDGCSASYCNGSFWIDPGSTCPYEDPISCQNNGCSWSGCSGLWQFWNPLSNCSNITDEYVCAMINGCDWDDGTNTCSGSSTITAVPQNCSMLNRVECSLVLGCLWSNSCAGTPVALKSCDEFSYVDCPTNLGCTVPNRFCGQFPSLSCTYFTNEIECSSVWSCKWVNGLCTGYITFGVTIDCSRISLSTCSSTLGCNLVTGCASQMCTDIISHEVCTRTPGCQWQRSACFWANALNSFLRNLNIETRTLVIYAVGVAVYLLA